MGLLIEGSHTLSAQMFVVVLPCYGSGDMLDLTTHAYNTDFPFLDASIVFRPYCLHLLLRFQVGPWCKVHS
jgi:hypothetical protein